MVFYKSQNSYLGSYVSENGSIIVLKENGKCEITVVNTVVYTNSNTCTTGKCSQLVGGSNYHPGLPSNYVSKRNETSKATSCTYEFYKDYILLTHNIDYVQTNKYNFSEHYKYLTWEGQGKLYKKDNTKK